VKIEKTFDVNISHKFPNGDIVSIRFGTTRAIDSIMESAPEESIDKFSRDLFMKVYRSTKADMKLASKKDALIREVVIGMKEAVKSQENERESEEILDDT
jgi:hypothetical protein